MSGRRSGSRRGRWGSSSRAGSAGLGTGGGEPVLDRRAEPMIDARLVGDAVVQMANLPLEANIQFMTLMATEMPFIGRG